MDKKEETEALLKKVSSSWTELEDIVKLRWRDRTGKKVQQLVHEEREEAEAASARIRAFFQGEKE